MFAAVFRQRRRILVCSILAVLIGLMSVDAFGQIIPTGPIWVVLISLFMMFGFVATILSILIIAVPSIRNIWEVVLTYSLIETSFITLAPNANAWLVTTDLRFVVSFCGLLLLYFAMYGNLLDRLPVWFSFQSRRKMVVKATPQAIWNAVVPDPDKRSDYWTRCLSEVSPDQYDDQTLQLRYAVGESLFENQTSTFVEREEPNFCRYYFMGDVSRKNRDFAEGIFEVQVEQIADGKSKVTNYMSRTATRLRTALFLWFDDAVGDQADAIRARLEGKRDLSMQGRFWSKVEQLA